MSASSRLLIVAFAGLASAVFGFLLTLDLWDLGTVVVNGTRFGQNTGKYIFLGQVLLCVGTTLAAIAFLLWAQSGPNRDVADDAVLPERLKA